MDAINKIIFYLNYYERKNSNTAVLSVILENIRKIPFMNIFELADLCFVSAATISRLVKDMGFTDFTKFKTEVQIALETNRNELITPEEFPPLYGKGEELAANIDKYLDWYIQALSVLRGGELADQFQNATEMLWAARRVCLLGVNGTWGIQLQRELALGSKRVITCRRDEDIVACLEKIEAGDVLFHSVRNKTQVPRRRASAEAVRAKGGKVICVVLEELADAVEDVSDVLLVVRRGPDRDVMTSLLLKLLVMVYKGKVPHRRSV